MHEKQIFHGYSSAASSPAAASAATRGQQDVVCWCSRETKASVTVAGCDARTIKFCEGSTSVGGCWRLSRWIRCLGTPTMVLDEAGARLEVSRCVKQQASVSLELTRRTRLCDGSRDVQSCSPELWTPLGSSIPPASTPSCPSLPPSVSISPSQPPIPTPPHTHTALIFMSRWAALAQMQLTPYEMCWMSITVLMPGLLLHIHDVWKAAAMLNGSRCCQEVPGQLPASCPIGKKTKKGGNCSGCYDNEISSITQLAVRFVIRITAILCLFLDKKLLFLVWCICNIKPKQDNQE